RSGSTMRTRVHLFAALSGSLLLAVTAGCSVEADVDSRGKLEQELGPGPCGIGGDVLAEEMLTAASIPDLSELEKAQIVLAVQESAHTDVTTVEEAFSVVAVSLIKKM